MLNLIGLSLDILGVIGLYFFELYPKGVKVIAGISYDHVKRNRLLSKISLLVLIIGFAFQISSNFY